MDAAPSKAELRAAALAARDALGDKKREAAARSLAKRGLPIEIAAGAVVSGYSPIRNEIDPAPLMITLAGLGARLALPVINARGKSLTFRAWSPNDRLVLGSLGIPEPSPAAAELIPNIMLVPLAAFDRAGHRIGYGAGHYDHTFAQLRKSNAVTGIGLAFAIQETPAIPALSHDVALDFVLTEKDVFDFPEQIGLRILFIGDVVGRTGRTAVSDYLPGMIRDWSLDLVIVNGENSAGGFGITEAIYGELLDAGADAITLGNHAWNQKEALVFIERAPRLIRPLNFARHTPGRGSTLIDTKNGKRALVINAMGRVFMEPLNDPFAAVDRELEACPLREAADAIVVDFHGEATSEKQGMGFFCDGRVSLVVGTHTHVPTADHQILPGGTAYMSDAGMTGDYDSIIGMQKEEPLRRFTTGIPSARFEPATGEATLSGVAVETDDATGFATKIAPVRKGGRLAPAVPDFWT